METSDSQKVYDVIKNLSTSHRNLRAWFQWPPDVFLFTAYVLKRSGAYRSIINARESEWAKDEYYEVRKHARGWLAKVQKSLTTQKPIVLGKYPNLLKKELERLSKKVSFSELRVLSTSESIELSYILIQCHVLADQASGGIGLLGASPKDLAIVRFLSNLLLVNRGTLSSLPKHVGTVIPKMRTPQSGLTLRSFSLHLTYHETEVEIMWRAVPWMNVDQNTLNIMCVPWPRNIMTKDFSSVRETFQSVRYFKFEKDENQVIKSELMRVTELVRDLQKRECNIHMIVLPEMALSESDYNFFLSAIKTIVSDLDIIPMIISGVREDIKGVGESNSVRLAAFFAGKWYDFSQTKHHRWKLDRNQLMQYGLPNRLSTERDWYENINMGQRRLSFLSPNPWLTLCPLICEDLAQLEPVSEIIRGVGPTLLFALLMDGPQIKERWSARYASIFADDPGTAVLSLTSLGMVKRSSKLEADNDKEENKKTIGLWKDQLKGWEQLDIENDDEVAVMTVSASWHEEFSADGRSDLGTASVFKLDSVRHHNLTDLENVKITEKQISEVASSREKIGRWLDLRELSTLIFAMEALISNHGANWKQVSDWLILEEKIDNKIPYSHVINPLIKAYKEPSLVGIRADRQGSWPTISLRFAKKFFEQTWKSTIVQEVSDPVNSKKNQIEDFNIKLIYWKRIFEKAKKELKKIKDADKKTPKIGFSNNRVKRAISLAVLIAVYNRLDDYRSEPRQLNFKDASQLFESVEHLIKISNY